MKGMKNVVLGAALVASTLAPVAWSRDYTGYTRVRTNLRSGPATGYPVVSVLPAGASLRIYGCISEWTWCDVMWHGERGWMSAQLIDYTYDGYRVPLYDYGPQIALPIIAFSFDLYWSSHYRGRSWYHDRDRWKSYHPHPSAPPRHPGNQGHHSSNARPSGGANAHPSSRPSNGGGKPSSGHQSQPSSRPQSSGGSQQSHPSGGGSHPQSKPAHGGSGSHGNKPKPRSDHKDKRD